MAAAVAGAVTVSNVWKVALGWAARDARPVLEAAVAHGPEWLRRESRQALRLIGQKLTARN